MRLIFLISWFLFRILDCRYGWLVRLKSFSRYTSFPEIYTPEIEFYWIFYMTNLNLLDFLYRRECARNVIIHPTQRRATTHLKRTWTNCLLTQNICKTSLAKIATTYVCVWVWDLDGSFTFHSKIKKDTNVSLNIWSSSNIYFSLLSSMTYLNNTIWLIILLSICCLFFRFIDINIRFGWFHFYILHYYLCFISLTRTLIW